MPQVKLRLITNGTVIPPGEWISEVSEVSVSFDEADKESYLANKGEDLFDKVWNNISWYLNSSPIPSVRVTMIYHRQKLQCGP